MGSGVSSSRELRENMTKERSPEEVSQTGVWKMSRANSVLTDNQSAHRDVISREGAKAKLINKSPEKGDCQPKPNHQNGNDIDVKDTREVRSVVQNKYQHTVFGQVNQKADPQVATLKKDFGEGDFTSETISSRHESQITEPDDYFTSRAEMTEGAKLYVDKVEGAIEHIRYCGTFPCDICCSRITEVRNISGNRHLKKIEIAENLAKVTEFGQMFVSVWERADRLGLFSGCKESLDDVAKGSFRFYDRLLVASMNFSDHSDLFNKKMEGAGCYKLLVEWFIIHVDESTMNKWEAEIAFLIMSILHNACRRVPSIRQSHHKVVPVLEKLSGSSDLYMQESAFFVLGYLVRKDEADKLSVNERCVNLLLSNLKRALASRRHTCDTKRPPTAGKPSMCITSSAVELVQCIEQLAINDKNKLLIARKGGIVLIGRMLEEQCSLEEKIRGSKAMWQLAFLPLNRPVIRGQKGIISDLTEYAMYNNEEHADLRNACTGALFEIFESKLPGELRGTRPNQEPTLENATSGDDKPSSHIMISYKWENPSKPVMREIKQQLRKWGYNVWMDEDHMMGDKIGAMADAVEKADLVLACITQGYQNSQDCRTEASYAYECKKKIVPLKVDEKFTATGWLGGITAGKIYYIVKGVHEVSKVLPVIVEQEFGVMWQNQSKPTDTLPQDMPDFPASEPPAPPPPKSDVPSWSVEKIGEWLQTNNVSTSNKRLRKLNGAQLLQLKKQLLSAPQSFYQSMKVDLKVEYMDVLSLAAALENLH